MEAMKPSKFKSWLIFTRERFHPPSHFAMLFVFVLFHVLIGTSFKVSNQQMIQNSTLDFRIFFEMLFQAIFSYLSLYLGVIFFYFKLRLYDEIKDYELDCVINPLRPLPRGLLKHQDLYYGIAVCLIIEQLCFIPFGINAQLLLLAAQAYSLLMYKEFFIRDYIRPHLTIYAIIHTVVTSFLTFAILGALKNQSFLESYTDHTNLYIALNNWILFNIFEFGRKTYAKEEEREGVDSYSSLFTPYGAFLLQLIQIILSHFFIFQIFGKNSILGLSILLTLFLLISALYLATEIKKWAKIYRSFSEIYIVLVFIFMLILFFI